jgi:hypothetical protein
MTHTISGKCGITKQLSTETYVTKPEREDDMSTVSEEQKVVIKSAFEAIVKATMIFIEGKCTREQREAVYDANFDLVTALVATAERTARDDEQKKAVAIVRKIYDKHNGSGYDQVSNLLQKIIKQLTKRNAPSTNGEKE